MFELDNRHYVSGVVGTVLLFIVVLFVQIPRTSVIAFGGGGLPWGSQAPKFILNTAKGDSVAFPQSDAPCVLVFTTFACQYSKDLKKELIAREPAGQWGNVILVSTGDLTDEHLIPEVRAFEQDVTERYLTLWDTKGQVFEDYQVAGVPAVYWVEQGTILDSATGLARSLSMIEDLWTRNDIEQ